MTKTKPVSIFRETRMNCIEYIKKNGFQYDDRGRPTGYQNLDTDIPITAKLLDDIQQFIDEEYRQNKTCGDKNLVEDEFLDIWNHALGMMQVIVDDAKKNLKDNKIQIGWYDLKQDKIFRNNYEYAAWYEDVLVPAGRYPMMVYDYKLGSDGHIQGHIGCVYIPMSGTVVSDDFGGRYFGVPISDYDNYKNAGKPSNHIMSNYMFLVADELIHKAEDTCYSLFEGFEAREVAGEWQGESFTTCGIYKI